MATVYRFKLLRGIHVHGPAPTQQDPREPNYKPQVPLKTYYPGDIMELDRDITKSSNLAGYPARVEVLGTMESDDPGVEASKGDGLDRMTVPELRRLADEDLELALPTEAKKADIIEAIRAATVEG